MNNRTQKPATTQRGVPPYVAYKTFSNFVDKLQRGMPNRIDRSVMTSLSGSNQSHLIAALEYLDLISSSGAPSVKLEAIVKSAGLERTKLLRKMLVDSYPFLFQDFELIRATYRQLEERFAETGATGNTVRKCINFFVGASRGASIQISPFLARTRDDRRQPKSSGVPDQRANESRDVSDGFQRELLSKFPGFDPDWSEELKGKWLDAFQELMRRGGK